VLLLALRGFFRRIIRCFSDSDLKFEQGGVCRQSLRSETQRLRL
jgi:hypothetical protein